MIEGQFGMWSLKLLILFLATSTNEQGQTTVTESLSQELLDGVSYSNQQQCETSARWWLSPAASATGAVKKAECVETTAQNYLPQSTGGPALPQSTRGPALPQSTRGPALPQSTSAPALPQSMGGPALPRSTRGLAFPAGTEQAPAYPKSPMAVFGATSAQ